MVDKLWCSHCSELSKILNNIVELKSGVTAHTVDNYEKIGSTTLFNAVNFKLEWNNSLAPIFEAKLTLNRPYNRPSTEQVQSLSIVFVGAVDTLFLGMYRDLMFLFWFKK